MIRLNEIQESKIINNGKAGLVKNVSLEMSRKTDEHDKSFPDFKIIFSENNGANIDIGIYYFKDKDFETEKQRNNRMNRYLSRLMHIARAVMGVDFSPSEEFTNVKDATDFCINIIEENSSNKFFDIFITFGTVNYPSKKGFLEVRYNVPFIKNSEDNITLALTKYADDIIDKDELIFLQKKNKLNDDSDIFTKDV